MAHKYLLLVSVFIAVSPTVPETRDLQDAEHGSFGACGGLWEAAEWALPVP